MASAFHFIFWLLIANEETLLNILEEGFTELKDKIEELFQKALAGNKVMERKKVKDMETNNRNGNTHHEEKTIFEGKKC